MKTSDVHATLRDLANRLRDARIDYAVIGGMALNLHRFERMTIDVILLMTPEALARFRDEIVGPGYAPAFQGAKKRFKATATGVPVDIIASGEYPGDAKPKPVSFPDPRGASEEVDGIRVLSLRHLIQLKLASGLSAPHRLKDLGDVQSLIGALHLPRDLASDLDPSVRDEYLRLWDAVDVAEREQLGPGQE
jgi:hypothetical protein